MYYIYFEIYANTKWNLNKLTNLLCMFYVYVDRVSLSSNCEQYDGFWTINFYLISDEWSLSSEWCALVALKMAIAEWT